VAGDHAQNGRLAATTGAEQAAVAPRGNLHGDIIDRHNHIKAFGDVDEFDFSHLFHWLFVSSKTV
jgi:hypothetical protein